MSKKLKNSGKSLINRRVPLLPSFKLTYDFTEQKGTKLFLNEFNRLVLDKSLAF